MGKELEKRSGYASRVTLKNKGETIKEGGEEGSNRSRGGGKGQAGGVEGVRGRK